MRKVGAREQTHKNKTLSLHETILVLSQYPVSPKFCQGVIPEHRTKPGGRLITAWYGPKRKKME